MKASQVYIGGPKKYQAYQQLRLAKQISNDNPGAVQMNEMTSENRWLGHDRDGRHGLVLSRAIYFSGNQVAPAARFVFLFQIPTLGSTTTKP